ARRTQLAAMRRFTIIAPIIAIVSAAAFVAVLMKAAIRHPQLPLAIGHAVILQGGLLLSAIAWRRRLTSTGSILPSLLVAFAIFDGLATLHFTEATLFN